MWLNVWPEKVFEQDSLLTPRIVWGCMDQYYYLKIDYVNRILRLVIFC